MRPKKLLFSEEDKKEIQKLRKELSGFEIDSAALSELYGAAEGGGCGAQCMITCAFWCVPACANSCYASCGGKCWNRLAVGWPDE
jgi:hypothetical protein